VKLFWRYTTLLALLAISLSNLATPPTIAAEGTLIAYVSPSRDNQQIHTINPADGVDRLV